MGIDFSKVTPPASPVESAPAASTEIETVQPYDIMADRQQMNETLTNSEEVDALVSTIEVNNLETIVSFGAEAAEEIAKASDVVLNSMSMSQLDESSEMLESLSKIMSKFDPSELQENKGLFILVKTSNPSSGEFQDRLIDGRPLYELVAEKVVEWGNMSMDGTYSNVGAVVGATYPEMSKILRKLMPHTYFLVPGYGAQGGTAADLKHCFNEDGLGAIVNSSRGIIAAYRQEKYKQFGPEHFAEASRQAVIDMVADINSVL